MKKHIYTAAAALTALGCLAFAILFVITLLPVGVESVRVNDVIDISASPLDASGDTYLLQVRGSLINDTDTPVTLERITLTVSDGRTRENVILEGVVLTPRLSAELADTWEGSVPFDRVDAVYVTLDGQSVRVENRVGSLFGADTVVMLVAAIVFALLCTGFTKQRYYLYQEDRMRAREQA